VITCLVVVNKWLSLSGPPLALTKRGSLLTCAGGGGGGHVQVNRREIRGMVTYSVKGTKTFSKEEGPDRLRRT